MHRATILNFGVRVGEIPPTRKWSQKSNKNPPKTTPTSSSQGNFKQVASVEKKLDVKTTNIVMILVRQTRPVV